MSLLRIVGRGGRLMRAAVCVCLAALSVSLAGQSIDGPQFEAASIKLNRSGSTGGGIGPIGDRVGGTNVTVKLLAGWAYDLRSERIVGIPEWAERERFDLNATAPPRTSVEDLRKMLQTLLAVRFRFTAHTESRDMPVWLLELARRDGRLGPGLRPCTAACDTPRGSLNSSLGVLKETGIPVEHIASTLAGLVRGHVIDRTGLSGTYDLDLEWAPESAAPETHGDRVSVFTAVQEQWGLRLESARAPLPVLVVDRVERPTED